jgi:hypothetical protein
MQLSWKGTYTLVMRYKPGDVVYFVDDGFTYVCVRESYGIPPYISNSGFELLAGFNITLLDGGEF